MTKIATDRRIARTKAGLQHALLMLILKKGYDAITVKDICQEANVARSTFYLHYASKDALKRGGLEQLHQELVDRQRQALVSESPAKGDGLEFGLTLFEHARDHLDLYQALAGSRGESIALEGIREILCDLVRSELAAANGKTFAKAIPCEFTVQYIVGAYMAVLTWWLDRGAKPPPQQVDAMFRCLAIEGISSGNQTRASPQA